MSGRNSLPRLDRKTRIFYNAPCPKIVGAQISPAEEKYLIELFPRDFGGDIFWE